LEAKILKLIKLIGEEVQIFETFLHYLNLQQDALVANNLESLQSVTQEQEELAIRTTRVEAERRALVDEICGELRRDHSDLTLSELTKLVAEPQSNQIQALQTTLLALHEQIATIKARNDFLIRKSMEYINTTIAQLGLTEQVSQTTYTADRTKAAPAAKTALVDRRA